MFCDWVQSQRRFGAQRAAGPAGLPGSAVEFGARQQQLLARHAGRCNGPQMEERHASPPAFMIPNASSSGDQCFLTRVSDDGDPSLVNITVFKQCMLPV